MCVKTSTDFQLLIPSWYPLHRPHIQIARQSQADFKEAKTNVKKNVLHLLFVFGMLCERDLLILQQEKDTRTNWTRHVHCEFSHWWMRLCRLVSCVSLLGQSTPNKSLFFFVLSVLIKSPIDPPVIRWLPTEDATRSQTTALFFYRLYLYREQTSDMKY